MSSEYDRTAAMMVALLAGRTRAEIFNFLKPPASMVYNVSSRSFAAARPEQGAGVAGRKVPNRSEARKRCLDFTERLEKLVKADQLEPTQTLAAQNDVEATTVGRELEEDLCCKSYRV